MNIWRESSKDKAMVFMAGPRQAGKTTLAGIVADSFVNKLYFNWDIPDHRLRLLEDNRFFTQVERRDASKPLVVLDEIHKYGDWKNYLKGAYDEFHRDFLFLVSGSGRLDTYQKGGDSLAGRYLMFHLWPFTLAELGARQFTTDEFLADPLKLEVKDTVQMQELWAGLEALSGFPEPFLSGSKRSYRRWSNAYGARLVREDIRDLSGVQAVGQMEMLYHLLPSRVGSSLSIPSLSRDLKVAYNTVRNWLDLLERFFLAFSIGPWTSNIARAIQKERKVYLWDTPRIKDPGSRFENQVALELWRAVSNWNDIGAGGFALHFIRNREKQEVDFLIANDGVPFLLVEAKLNDTQPSAALRKFQAALNVPAVQLVSSGDTFRLLPNADQQILVAPACHWLAGLP